MPDFDAVTEQLIANVTHAPLVGASVVLSVTAGAAAGTTFNIRELAYRRALLGSSPACEVHLADRTVSRRHAAIELDASGGVRLLDLGSRNGTFVLGLRVTDVVLRSGDEITLGAAKVKVVVDSEVHAVESSHHGAFFRLVGASPAMRRIYPLLERVAKSSAPVLIEGEPGTGKELLAESLHEAGATPDGPFVAFEPAATATEQIEGVLFGARGEGGLLQEASGGTLFIDEVSDLPAAAQLKMLRALEHRGRAGAPRIVASTRRDLDREVQERRFREDLFMALCAVRVDVPPLRKREGDVALLTRAFWVALGGDARDLPADLVQRFAAYHWPGNVRELQGAVARALATGDRGVPAARRVAASDLIGDLIDRNVPLPRARQEIVMELERRYTQAMLDKHGGHVGRAAAASGIGRRYFQALRAKK